MPAVGADRRLPVGVRQTVAPAPVARQRPVLEEAPELLVPPEPRGQRRHRPGGVLGEQRHDLVHVALGHRGHVALDHVSDAVVAQRAERLLLALLRQLLVHRLPGPLQRAVHGGDARVERLRRLLRREAEHLAQDERRALVRGEVLERGDERQLHALAQLVAGLGRGVAVLEAEPLIREGLHPGRLDRRHPDALVVRVERGAVVEREHPLRAAIDQVQAGVGGDRVEPGAKRAPALELADRAPGAQHRVLERVLGVVQGADHPVAVRVELALVGLHEACERGLVAVAGGLEIGCHLHGHRPPG
jgi:hypothetical protein